MEEQKTVSNYEQIHEEGGERKSLTLDDRFILKFMTVHPLKEPLSEEVLLEIFNMVNEETSDRLMKIYKITEEGEGIADTKKQAVRDSRELAGITTLESRKEQEEQLRIYIEKLLKNNFKESDYQKVLDNICKFLEKSIGKLRIQKIVNEMISKDVERKNAENPIRQKIKKILGGYDSC